MLNLIVKNSEKQIINLNILKSHLRIAHNHEDEYLKTIIDTATDILENNLELSMLYKTYNCVIHNYKFNYPIVLPIRNIKSICNVWDSDNNCISFDTNNKHEIKINTTTVKIPISIQYIAGFTNNIEEIPRELKLAVLQISKNIYDTSEDCISDSKYLQHVINKYKQLSL